MTHPLIISTSTSDPRIEVVAEAMVAYDAAAPSKTWRELAAVALAAADRWHALNLPRAMVATPHSLGPAGSDEHTANHINTDSPAHSTSTNG